MEQGEIFIAEAELEKIIRHLKEKQGHDLTNYAKTSLRRRVARFMKLFGIRDAENLFQYLFFSPVNLRTFIEEITVNTTEMFRDPSFWLALRKEILPEINEHESVRIWHAGCSTGEEVFSMAILLHELGMQMKTKQTATDLNESVLAITKKGFIKPKEFDLFRENYHNSGGTENFEKYFQFKGDDIQFREDLASNIIFKKHNLVNDSAFSKFDLILCRNVMIYFDGTLQSRVLNLFHESLFKSGFVAIGRKESLAFVDDGKKFSSFNEKERIYKRKEIKD
jgi:chemotaxis protein methyltransferase CheR